MKSTLLAFVDVAMGERLSRRRNSDSDKLKHEGAKESGSTDLMAKPFFNWRWSVVDVAMLIVLAYTFR